MGRSRGMANNAFAHQRATPAPGGRQGLFAGWVRGIAGAGGTPPGVALSTPIRPASSVRGCSGNLTGNRAVRCRVQHMAAHNFTPPVRGPSSMLLNSAGFTPGGFLLRTTASRQAFSRAQFTVVSDIDLLEFENSDDATRKGAVLH